MHLPLLLLFGFLVLQASWIIHWRRSRHAQRTKRVLVGLHLLFSAAAPVILFFIVSARAAGPFITALVIRPTFAWQFFWLLASVVSLPIVAGRGMVWLVARFRKVEAKPTAPPATPSLTRRRVLQGAVLSGASAAVYGLARTVAAPEVTRLTLPFAELDQRLEGLRILHLSDIHFGFYVAEEEVARVIELCRPLSPDLAVVTGDLVDHNPRYAIALARHFGALQVPLGWHAIVGNHDIYTGADAITEIMRSAGIDMLRNQHLDFAARGLPLLLCGTDDSGDGWTGSGGPIDLAGAMRGAPADRFNVLLAHRPTGFDQALGKNIALTLAGHTHGGQLSLPFGGPGLAHLTYQRPRGHYVEGSQHLYVSRGLGSVGLPFRLNSPPEITLITLARG